MPVPRAKLAARASTMRMVIAMACLLAMAAAYAFADQAASYRESLLDRGLSTDDWYAKSLLIKSSRMKGPEATRLMAEAAEFAPNLPPVHLRLALQAVPDMFVSVSQVFAALDAYKRSFWWSMSLRGTLLYALMGAVVSAIVVLIIVRLATDFSLIKHDIDERHKRLMLPMLILPFSVLGPVMLLLAAFMTVCLYAKKGRLAFFLVAGFVFAAPVMQGTIDAVCSSRTSQMRAMVGVNEGSDNRYAIEVLGAQPDYMSRFAYGLALRREGRAEESIDVYQKLLAQESGNPKVLVNLGNALFAAGRFPEAREAYDKAHASRKSVLSAYNLSQAARALFDYEAGDKFYAEAVALGPGAVSHYNSIASKNPNRTVMDAVYDTAELESYAFRTSHPVATIYPLGTTAVMAGAGVLVLVFAYMSFTGIELAGRCTNCGVVVCELCAPSKALGGRCAACHKLMTETDDTSPKAKVARMLSSMHMKNALRDRIKALSLAPPGIAQIYAGKLTEGLMYLTSFFFLLIGAVLCAMPVFTMGLTGFTHLWLTPWMLIGAGVVYLLSTLSVNRRVDIGWL